MFICMNLSKKNLPELKQLSKKRNEFNPLNADFFKIYDEVGFTQQLSLRKKVHLMMYNNKYVGYIWVTSLEKSQVMIHAMYILKEYHSIESYEAMINTVREARGFVYICEKNECNFQILKALGFEKKEGTLELIANLHALEECSAFQDVEYETLLEGRDEEKRCTIQNEVFKNSNRIPLTIADIFYDESQDYYFDRGSIFIKNGTEYIGYGQIIIENDFPHIVNFGIVKKHRGKGYGKCLLFYLMNLVSKEGFSSVKLKVKSDNNIAFELYKSMGFTVKKEYYKWELKR